MTDVAYWPQRAPRGRRSAFTVLFALALLLVVSGPSVIVDWRDLQCAPGSSVRAVSIAYWAVVCQRDYPGPSTTPVARYVGLFLTSLDVRVFDADFIGESYHGPGLGVRVR